MKARIIILSALVALVGASAQAQQLAFPGAQGWGRFATGGRTGSVYHVTNLNDSGSGSLRDAVSQPNRIVVFDVSGVIKLNSRLVFSKNLTLAGQTAPGEGVVVYGDAVSFSGADNAIVRHMRFRMGKGGSSGKDAVEFLMCGATAIEIGTANFIDPTVTIKVRDGLNKWLDSHGYQSVQEIIGAIE